MEQNDDVQRVEVETESEPSAQKQAAGGNRGFTFRFGNIGTNFGFAPGASNDPRYPMGKPPRIAAWICLVIAWLFLGSSLPFTVFLGVPFALAALLLGAVCLTRGGTATGLAVMALGSVGSFVVYIVGLFRFLF